MNELVIANSQADADAVEAVKQHHAQLNGTLVTHVEALVSAAAAGDEQRASAAKADLVKWCTAELVPHAKAEEATLYPAATAKDEGRLLADAMVDEHRVIVGLIAEIGESADPVRAAAGARALQEVFEIHMTKENEQILPLLAAAPEVSVADLLAGMHDLLGAEAAGHASHEATGDHEQHGCTCGEHDENGYPELDARAIPHAIRHATIFGALDAVRPGRGLVLVAPHDPLPLLAQIERREPDTFDVTYLERGPETWRLALVRRG